MLLSETVLLRPASRFRQTVWHPRCARGGNFKGHGVRECNECAVNFSAGRQLGCGGLPRCLSEAAQRNHCEIKKFPCINCWRMRCRKALLNIGHGYHPSCNTDRGVRLMCKLFPRGRGKSETKVICNFQKFTIAIWPDFLGKGWA